MRFEICLSVTGNRDDLVSGGFYHRPVTTFTPETQAAEARQLADDALMTNLDVMRVRVFLELTPLADVTR